MSRKYTLALVLALGTLSACQDSPVASRDLAPADEVQVIRPEEYARYGITPMAVPDRTPKTQDGRLAAAYAQIDYYSIAAYNGVFGTSDQAQLISVQNAFSGIAYHTLQTTFVLQPNCSGSPSYVPGDYFSAYGNGGLSSQRTVRWNASSVYSATVNGTHFFEASSGDSVNGSPSATFYSVDSVCY